MTTSLDPRKLLRTLLEGGDVRAALRFLNALTEHRFTAMYRFDNETLRNLYFFDRENPTQETTPDIPVLASYCVFVRDGLGTFSTPDSTRDGRVDGHPKRLVVQSYCGVPLRDLDGAMFGTICHFDFRPLPISDANIDLMESIAPMLRRSVAPPALLDSAASHA